MPITVKVVSQEAYDAWLDWAIDEYGGTRPEAAAAARRAAAEPPRRRARRRNRRPRSPPASRARRPRTRGAEEPAGSRAAAEAPAAAAAPRRRRPRRPPPAPEPAAAPPAEARRRRQPPPGKPRRRTEGPMTDASWSRPARPRAGVRRLRRAAEAAGDAARGLHRLRRAGLRAGAGASGDRRSPRSSASRSAPARRARSTCGGTRDIDARDGAHRAAGRSPRAGSSRDEALAHRARARGLRGGDAGALRQPGRGRAARLHHLLLRGRLLDVAEAGDAAEHRHRRRRRGVPADDRLGGGDRRRRAREPRDVRADLPLDAAAFLGAGAVPQRRLRAAPACRCCR